MVKYNMFIASVKFLFYASCDNTFGKFI